MIKSEKDIQKTGKKVFNVLHVVSRLPLGGVENMLMKVIKGYDKDRYNPVVCCIKEGGEIAEALKNAGYKVEILNKMRGHSFDLSAIYEIYKLIKREDIHILRTHQYHANLYGRIAGILAGVPVIVPSFHSRYKSPKTPKLHRRLFNSILGIFSDAFVAVSPAVSDDILKYDLVRSSKIRIIYNGINLKDFALHIPKTICRKEFNLPEGKIIIGTVGRLKEEKGHRILIEAASNLDNVLIAIAGDGPLMQKLKVLAEKLGVKCLFMGMLSPERIPFFLKSLDIFCFPSLWEGFPSALIEAMAAGLPVIASNLPSNIEIIGESGVIFPAGDSKKLTESLKNLLENFILQNEMGIKASERVKMFSIENTVEKYQALFEELLKKKEIT